MISALTIDNFKCFSVPTRFTLSPLNLFTGYNGRGKSSVFQVLLLLAQSLRKNGNVERLEVNGEFVRLDLFEDLVNVNRTENNIYFELESTEEEYSSVKLGYKELSDRVGEIVELEIDGKSYFQQAASLSEKKDVENERHLYTYPKDFHCLFMNYNYVSADRLGPTRYEEKEDVSESNPIGCNGEHRLNMLTQNEELLHEVSHWVDYIMDGGTLEVSGMENKESAVLNLLFRTGEKRTKGIKSINCGFGYSYILPIVIMALTIKKGCLFIENPEAHLHPEAQSRLMELICQRMENRNIQVFIETHSEHIVNAVRLRSLKPDSPISHEDVSIYFFDKDFSIIPLKMDEEAQISNWPTGFFDQQEIDLSEILKLGLFK